MKLKNPTSFSPFSAESLASLFSEKDQAGDLTFHTSDGDAVKAHSFIIAASMNPAWRDLIASHAYVNFGDEGRVVIILPDVSTAELDAVLCFIYGMIDTYRTSTGQLWTKLLNTERVPHKLQIRKRSLSEEIHTPTSTFEAIKDDSDYYGGYHGDHAFDDDDAERLSIPGSELGSEAEAKTLHNLNDIAIDDEVVLSTLPSHIVKKKEFELRAVGSLWQCILTNCHYIAPDFPSLSDHLRSIHSAEKISLLRCEICSKLCKNKSSIVRHTFGEDCHRYYAEHKNRLMKFLHPFIHKIPLLNKSKVLAIVASYDHFFRIFETSSKYKCAECAVSFYSFSNLESHVNLNHLGVEESTLSKRWSLFTCEVCLRIFSQPENYYRHINEKHGVRREFFADDFATIDLKHAWQEVCDEKDRLKDAAKYSGYETGRKATKKGLFYCKVRFSCVVSR